MSSTSLELKNQILRAGAGAGKTTTLTETFLSFAARFKNEHGRFPRIVVTTFTRKATQELKERLLKKALEDGREDLFHYVSAKSQVQISTIHGVLSIFIARYGSSIGLTPDYLIKSDFEIKKSVRGIMRRYLIESPQSQELLEEYDFSTLESSLIAYFHHRISFGQLDFASMEYFEEVTRKLCQDELNKMKRTCLEICQQATNDKWVEHANEWTHFKGKIQEESWSQFFDRLAAIVSLRKPTFSNGKPVFSGVLHEEFVSSRKILKDLSENPCYLPEFWKKHQSICELFEQFADYFFNEFLKHKLESGQISMGDLETLATKIVVDAPEAAEKFSLEWDYWMIDEYQDTSPIQVRLLEKLIGKKPYFIVGDPQQSIYLFRGARSEVFHEKVEAISKNGGEVKVKLVNYRSTPEVLAFINSYFTKLSPHFSSMEPDPNKKISEDKNPVVQFIQTTPDESSEQDSELLTAIARVQELLKTDVSPEKICILARTHKTLEALAKLSQFYGVPVQLHSQSQFYERREVMDALSILKFLVNPHDNVNLIALLRSPWFVMSDSDILKYCHSYQHSYWSQIQKNTTGLTVAPSVQRLNELLLLSEEKGLSWALKEALIQFGLFDYSMSIDSSGRREANLWKVVSLLSEQERRPGFNFLDFLDASMESLSADEGGEDADATPVIEPKRVNLMTVHASKGLQFDHIILPKMGQESKRGHSPIFCVNEKNGKWSLKIKDPDTGKFNGSILADQINEEFAQREADEYLRVLYVALTRAKKGITLIWGTDPSENSWASRCPIHLEPGLHEMKDFSYLVRQDNLRPEPLEKNGIVSKDVRPLWKSEVGQSKVKSIAVTELVKPESDSKTYEIETESLIPSLNRAQQGTEAHRIFEALKYTSYKDLITFVEPSLKKAIDFIVNNDQVPLKEIIKNGFVEWGFAFKYKDCLIQGQIDLWGIVDGTLWIIDYKTGSQKYSQVAIDQLKSYAWALTEMKYVPKNQKIVLGVVYPMDEIIKTQTLADIGALTSQIEKKIDRFL